MRSRPIPSSGEPLPVIGLGTWQTFDTDSNDASLTEVLHTFHAGGGRLIDSSPMYGRAESTIGRLTAAMPQRDDFFYATKVWTTGRAEGIAQMEQSFRRMGRPTIDLLQIHNLVDWKTHLSTLRKWKEEGRVHYIGITHYTDGQHAELERVLRQERFDFVQFNYSIADRHAEQRLLPTAADLGVATLINRPFGEGALLRRLAGTPLPGWAVARGIKSWAAYCVAFILAHPAVTCVIPATSKAEHMREILEGDVELTREELEKGFRVLGF
ncbi:aldo/keto reductase [Flaviaesturariibacter flavus]|uniref:Aldo/keto reductase n=1 Tax=Flaviaesturariibacter flavus TaxID=2502780 RepID=A0A4R1B9J3_9BACT|nr:aldo/keto reductase [Flaviaesturariibacter flavus]TCJ13586.1 aldo/keto reductase [Flaviaesturariibacter flavus]